MIFLIQETKSGTNKTKKDVSDEEIRDAVGGKWAYTLHAKYSCEKHNSDGSACWIFPDLPDEHMRLSNADLSMWAMLIVSHPVCSMFYTSSVAPLAA
jgi:hypothetical protein